MHKHSILVTTALVCGLSLTAVPARAQDPPSRPPTPVPSPRAGIPTDSPDHSVMDEMFVRKAASGGQAEIELAVVAQQKTSNDAVKQLAQRIETDHKKANDELMAMASKKDLKIDAKPSADKLKLKAQLDKLSGMEFDRAYLNAMVKDHQKDIKEFERQASAGSDPELKAFASKTLPDLKEHLRMSMDAQKLLTSTQ
jgi:putative membrane protein